MKKTYIKPQLWVVATNAGELLLNQTSWTVYPRDGYSDKDIHGNIIYDEGEEYYEKNENEYDPWKGSNW